MGAVRQTLAQGTALLTLSRVWEAFLGYALNLFLARSLGPELFGLFGVIITVMLWLEICINEALPVWVTRTVAGKENFWAIPRRYLLTQAGLGVTIAMVLILFAPALAVIFQAEEYANHFRLAAIDIPLAALGAIFMAVLSGRRHFAAESALLATYTFVKLSVTMLLILAAGLSISGAILGSIAASVAALGLTLVVIKRYFGSGSIIGKQPAEESTAEVFRASGGQTALLLSRALLISAPLWIIKATSPAADAGYFQAASLIALIPITLAGGLGWALFASYADAFARKDMDRCRHYLVQTTRLVLTGGILWAALIIPTATPLLTLMFSGSYASGAPFLMAIALGTSIGSLAYVLAPTLLIEGRYGKVIALALALVGLQVAASLVLTSIIGPMGTAVAVSGVFVLAGLFGLHFVWRHVKGEVASLVLRMIVPGIAVFIAASLLSFKADWTLLIGYAALSLMYGALMIITGAVGKKDLTTIRGSLFARGAAQ